MARDIFFCASLHNQMGQDNQFYPPGSPIDLSTVFSTFDMDKLGKIRQHHWKERLDIGKTAKFESDSS